MDMIATVSDAIKFAETHGNSELADKLREGKSQILALQDENNNLRNRLNAKSQMKAFGPHNYFYRNENTDGPYCPVCWQRDGKEVLLPASADYMTGHERYCQVCHTGFFEGPRKQSLQAPKLRSDFPR